MPAGNPYSLQFLQDMIYSICFLLFSVVGNNLPYQSIDICSLYGTVYVEKERTRADFLVFVEESEAFADLVVHNEDNLLFADKSGLWHITKNRGLANFTIFYVDDKYAAHFTIHFTDAATFAGCNQ